MTSAVCYHSSASIMHEWIIIISVICLGSNLQVNAKQKFNWAYGGSIGPSTWKNNYKGCGGSHQSPINIETKNVQYDPSLKPFNVKLENGGNKTFKVENLGLNAEIFFENTTWKARFEGNSEYCYQLLQIHFHWGSKNSQGSEHQINGKKFPLEAHIVMWNCRLYTEAKVAAGSVNGLAVMGILFEVNDTAPENPVMKSVVSAFSEPEINQCPCKTYENIGEVKMNYFDINQLLPKNRKDFYRYQGSLTTPPCTENVLWTVFKETQTIRQSQINIFRNLKNRATANGGIINMYNNFRPVNPLNPSVPINSKRVVTASFSASPKLYPTLVTACLSILSIIMLGINNSV